MIGPEGRRGRGKPPAPHLDRGGSGCLRTFFVEPLQTPWWSTALMYRLSLPPGLFPSMPEKSAFTRLNGSAMPSAVPMPWLKSLVPTSSLNFGR